MINQYNNTKKLIIKRFINIRYYINALLFDYKISLYYI